MTITLRGNQTSPLTYGELDANFTTLGLTDGMTAANVAVSVNTATATTATITTGNIDTVNADDIDVSNRIIVNTTASGNDPTLQVVGEQFDSTIITRQPASFAGEAQSMIVEADFTASDTNLAAGLGTGITFRVKGEDYTKYVTNLKGGIDTWVSDSDYDTYFKIECRNSGSNQAMVTISPTEITFHENTDRVKVNSGTAFNLVATNYADLPSSPSLGDMAMLNNDGASAYQGRPIYYSNQWQYFSDNSAVATS